MRSLSVLLLFCLSAQAGVDNLAFIGRNEVNRNHEMDCEIVGNRAFICCGYNQGLEAYDITDPANPVRTWLANGPNCWRAQAYGDTVIFAFCRREGVVLYDISSPDTVLRVGRYDPAGNREALEGGVLVGDTLYAAAHQNGIYLIDVTNPAAPQKVAALSLAPDAAAWNVVARDSFLFVANGRHGLAVAGLAGGLHLSSRLELPGTATDIVLDGDVAVLSLGVAGLATIGISDPHSPVLLDTIATDGCAWGIDIFGHLVACGSWRVLELFDVSSPHDIRRIGRDNTTIWAHGAAIRNDSLIVVADWRGMSCYRVGADAGPDIDIVPEIVDFGAVTSSADTTITVCNTGSAALNVASVSSPNGFTVQPGSFSVAPGDSQVVTVTAVRSGSNGGNLVFNCDDPDEAQRAERVYKNNAGYPQYGSVAPDFTLLGTDALFHTLSSYRGRVVYLDFGASW